MSRDRLKRRRRNLIGEKAASPISSGGKNAATSARRSRTILVDPSSSSSEGATHHWVTWGFEIIRKCSRDPASIHLSSGPSTPIEPMASPLLLTYGQLAPSAKSPSPEFPRPDGLHHSPEEVTGTSAAWDARGSGNPGELGQPSTLPSPPQESGLEFYERWLRMTRSWEETARTVNALVTDVELRFRLAPSLVDEDDLKALLERANERFRRLERRKLEYE